MFIPAVAKIDRIQLDLADPGPNRRLSEEMIELTIQLFGIVVEVLFSAPRTFSKELIDHDGQWLTDASNGFAVPPEQVRLRQADVLFGYDLSVQLFGGNGHVSVDSQKASFSAKNARGRADGKLLRQMVRRFLQHFAKEKLTIALSANAHAKTESKAIQEEYVQRFRFDPRITKPGAVGYLHLDDWPTDVRFIVEPLLGTDDSLFLAWATRFPAGECFEIPDKIVRVFEEVAALYGLKFRPLG